MLGHGHKARASPGQETHPGYTQGPVTHSLKNTRTQPPKHLVSSHLIVLPFGLVAVVLVGDPHQVGGVQALFVVAPVGHLPPAQWGRRAIEEQADDPMGILLAWRGCHQAIPQGGVQVAILAHSHVAGLLHLPPVPGHAHILVQL